MSFEIMRRKERGTDGKRSVTERERKREEERAADEKRKKKSEMTKCNLSAFSDSQRLK